MTSLSHTQTSVGGSGIRGCNYAHFRARAEYLSRLRVRLAASVSFLARSRLGSSLKRCAQRFKCGSEILPAHPFCFGHFIFCKNTRVRGSEYVEFINRRLPANLVLTLTGAN